MKAAQSIKGCEECIPKNETDSVTVDFEVPENLQKLVETLVQEVEGSSAHVALAGMNGCAVAFICWIMHLFGSLLVLSADSVLKLCSSRPGRLAVTLKHCAHAS